MQLDFMAHRELCQQASNDAHVVIADVRNSTQLNKEGRQRDVNLIGAACIASVRNQFPLDQIPYVFGGDGATFLVDDADLEKCMDALHAVQKVAQLSLHIGLRIGSVSVRELREQNTDVFHGKVKSGAEEIMTILRGEGIALADSLIKQRDRNSAENSPNEEYKSANLEGLSCRLMPFASQRGRVCSIVIEPIVHGHDEDKLFEEIFSVLKGKENFDRYCPIQENSIHHKWISPQWKSEAAINQTDSTFLTRIKFLFHYLMMSIVTKYVFYFNKSNSMTGLPSRYVKELPEQSDWVKVNGSLYFILDMTHNEETKFRAWLEAKESAGLLRYGMHASTAALVTCHLHSSSQLRHFHFVDGNEGGLTAAATQLKAKAKKAS